MSATLRIIKNVENHPNAEKLSLNYLDDDLAIISNKDETKLCTLSNFEECLKCNIADCPNTITEYTHRYVPGSYVIYFDKDSILPEKLLKDSGYWDEEKQKGALSGALGNKVKPIKMRGIVSPGIIMHLPFDFYFGDPLKEGTDLSERLGVK